MKKFLAIIIIFAVVIGGFFTYKFVKKIQKDIMIKEIKKGWYVEVINEHVKVRKKPDITTSELMLANKGDVFKVLDMENLNGNYWYKIEYMKEKEGWIANPIGHYYLDDINNPKDVAVPKIKFFNNVYYVDSIDDINTNGRLLIVDWNLKDVKYDDNTLLVTDDRPKDVKVTYKVYHEVDENIDQYWIQYTATDAFDKSDKIVQKIVFNKRPSEDKVSDFKDLKR